MEPATHHIEIFAPFGEAYELTKGILFRPFDIAKWFVIGFAAWLATFFSGASFNYNKIQNWNTGSHRFAAPSALHQASALPVIITIIIALVVLVLVALFLWLNSRGRFMFVDCIVRNRAAIVAPWREYRVEANRFFLFQLIVTGCTLLLLGSAAVAYFLTPWRAHPSLLIALLVVCSVSWIVFMILYSLVTRFMVVLMYRRRCGPMEALQDVCSLLFDHLGVFILFELFTIVLYVAALIVSCLAGCVTCCLAIIPYVGTVILLPIVMVLFAFPLCFLRQFGDAYDVWAVTKTLPPPPQIPPVQERLTPL
ncbi:MAG: hypothetical protein ABI233_01375 [Chthoniobacterales bacterium]